MHRQNTDLLPLDMFPAFPVCLEQASALPRLRPQVVRFPSSNCNQHLIPFLKYGALPRSFAHVDFCSFFFGGGPLEQVRGCTCLSQYNNPFPISLIVSWGLVPQIPLYVYNQGFPLFQVVFPRLPFKKPAKSKTLYRNCQGFWWARGSISRIHGRSSCNSRPGRSWADRTSAGRQNQKQPTWIASRCFLHGSNNVSMDRHSPVVACSYLVADLRTLKCLGNKWKFPLDPPKACHPELLPPKKGPESNSTLKTRALKGHV